MIRKTEAKIDKGSAPCRDPDRLDGVTGVPRPRPAIQGTEIQKSSIESCKYNLPVEGPDDNRVGECSGHHVSHTMKHTEHQP